VLYGAALHHAQVDKEPKPVAPYRIPADLMAHSKHLHRTTCLNTGSHGPHYETASTGVLKGRTIYCNGRDEKLAMVNILPCQYADV